MEILGTQLRIKEILAQAKEKGYKVIIVDEESAIAKTEKIYGVDVAIISMNRIHLEDQAIIAEISKPQVAVIPQPIFPKVDIIELMMESARKMDRDMREMSHIAELANRLPEIPKKNIKKPVSDRPKPFKGHTNKFKNPNFKRR